MGSVEEIYESEVHRKVTRRTSFKIQEVRGWAGPDLKWGNFGLQQNVKKYNNYRRTQFILYSFFNLKAYCKYDFINSFFPLNYKNKRTFTSCTHT